MGGARRSVAAAVLVVATACGGDRAPDAVDPSAAATVRIGPLTPRDPDRISPAQAAAIRDLAAAASSEPPDPHAGHMTHDPPSTVQQLGAADRAAFDEQWAAARAAAAALDTPAEATAAGYTKSSMFLNGIGAHWVDWTRIDAPFDPARPAMLLFDDREQEPELVAYSYWIRAAHPDGFAGPNDVWHQHTNLCIVNGWVDREEAATPADCAGSFLGGADLWMLHAWVVPGHENESGPFAVIDRALCPRDAGVPDDLRCPPG